MRSGHCRHVFFAAILILFALPLKAQQTSGNIRWIDFHDPKDQNIVAWIERSLQVEKWTAIREIGVEYDAALVVTTLRASPQAMAGSDTFSVWSVSLKNHALTPILHGVNLRWLDWMLFAEGEPRELGAIYDDCSECAAVTYFTAFHYDLSQHLWTARWMRGGQAATIWSENVPAGAGLKQVYAVLAEPNGREWLATWSHFDYADGKPPEDFVYEYEVDPFSMLERTSPLAGKMADALKQRICRAQDAVAGMARGQDSDLCLPYRPPNTGRKPAIGPPANNHGQSVPPGHKPQPH